MFSSSVFHCSWLMAGTNPSVPSLPAPSLQNWLPSTRSQGGYKVKMKGGPVLCLSSLAWSSSAARMDPKHQHLLRSRLQPCSSPRALASQLQCIYLECHSYLSRLGTSSSSCIQSVWQRGKHKRLWTFDTGQEGRDCRMEVSLSVIQGGEGGVCQCQGLILPERGQQKKKKRAELDLLPNPNFANLATG